MVFLSIAKIKISSFLYLSFSIILEIFLFLMLGHLGRFCFQIIICFLDESSAYAASLGLVQGDHNYSNPYHNLLFNKIPQVASIGLLQDSYQQDYNQYIKQFANNIPYAASIMPQFNLMNHGGHHYSNHHHYSKILEKIMANSNTQLIFSLLSSFLTSIVFSFISNILM